MSAISFNLSKLPAFPLATFFKFLDLKLGSEILTFFLILNKVAGVYGLLAVFFGASFAQVSLYVYSVASIGVALWGLKGIGQASYIQFSAYFTEDAPKVLLYAHLYTIDHAINSLYTLYFGVQWYKYTPHDGRRVANSDAQKDILAGSPAVGGGGENDDAARVEKAQAVWKDERAFAAAVLFAGWLIKIYFILILYSFATHLRRGTWRSLISTQLATKNQSSSSSSSRRPASNNNNNSYSYSHLRNSSTASTGAGGAGNDVVWNGDDEDENGDIGGKGEEMGDEELDRQIRMLEGKGSSSDRTTSKQEQRNNR